MRCGAPSSAVLAKEFAHGSKSVVVPIPFCEVCEQRRAKRKRVGVIFIPLLVATGLGSFALPAVLKGEIYQAIGYGLLLMNAIIAVPLIFYVYGAFGFNLVPKRFTDTEIVLAGVSDEYAEAIEELHAADNPFKDEPAGDAIPDAPTRPQKPPGSEPGNPFAGLGK
jgi:hypothetical protein